MSATWPVIILGGTGYVAGELLRLVLGHPRLELAASVSSSQAGEPIGMSFPHLAPALGGACFASQAEAKACIEGNAHSVLLSAAPHGESAALIGQMLDDARAAGTKLTVVDASADFRFTSSAAFEAIYGKPHPRQDLLADFTCAVPEQARDTTTAHACQPGCFATSMLLGIVPLVAAGLVEPKFFVSAVTGSTGAGRKPRDTTHHPLRQSNLFAYQPLVHRHQPEVAGLALAATGQAIDLNFVPHSGPFARGIHATIFAAAASAVTTDDVLGALSSYYADAPLVGVGPTLPLMKDIAGSCHAQLSATAVNGTVVVCSVIDNLLKGAAGGCLQWLNRLLGLPETEGLTAPAIGWL